MSSSVTSTELAIIVPHLEPQPSHDHILNPRVLEDMQMTRDEMIQAARMTNSKLTAICGFQWRPTGAVGTRPICDACQNLADNL